jgi:hypothetical protein
MLGKTKDFTFALDAVKRIIGVPSSFGRRKKEDLAELSSAFCGRIREMKFGIIDDDWPLPSAYLLLSTRRFSCPCRAENRQMPQMRPLFGCFDCKESAKAVKA